ncbi:MAG: DUF3574 domain-containing protein [Xanthobacteraceae bacterium]
MANVSAAAQAAALACRGAQKSELIAQLLFGRDIGHRVGVSEAAWQRFVAQEITPRFPRGLTVIGATGQWRDRADRKTVREPSYLVMIALPGKSEDQARLDAIVAAYNTDSISNRSASSCSPPVPRFKQPAYPGGCGRHTPFLA